MTHSQLDQRICDCEDSACTQTYREYIRESENIFELCNEPIDDFGDEDLNEYLEILDYLWEK